MLKTPQEEQQWLKQLQNDLIEDRAKEQTQADPIYYAIRDFQELVTADGHHDYLAFYDAESCESYTEETIFELLDQEQLDELLEEGTIEKTDSGYSIQDTTDFQEWLSDHMDQIYCVYMVSHSYVVPDTMFLTRKDADSHLEANRHHYTQNATSYAMTGWRSPRYEHLIQLLRNIDFDKSTLVLKEPEQKEENHA